LTKWNAGWVQEVPEEVIWLGRERGDEEGGEFARGWRSEEEGGMNVLTAT
jgi:hypothetical protein